MGHLYYVAGATVLFAFLLQCFHFMIKRHDEKRSKRRLPPGPAFALPFLGHLPFLKKPLHETLARLAARYGPLFSLRLGRRPAVVVTTMELAKECFSSGCDVALANRPHFPSVREVSFDYAALSVASYGPHWRAMRRTATVHLLSARRVDFMSDAVIAHEVRAMVGRLAQAASGAPARVELKRRLFDLSHSVLVEAFARTRTTYSDDADMSEEARVLKDIVDEILPLVGVANLWDYLPVLRWLDVHGVRRRLTDKVNRRNAFIYKLIDAERQKQLLDEDDAGAGEKQGMIGVMLSLQKSEPDLYTDTFIAALVANLLGAGTETTSTTTEWAMALLLNHPEVLRKAQEEIDARVGGSRRLLDKNDLPHLPYLHCIISETLRLRPAVLTLLPHEAATDCELHGYNIPAGTILLVNAYAIHMDPAAWEAPEEFRPERFEHGGAEGKFMIPFGMGRRGCPGESLAMRTMGLVLGTLIQCFDWSRVGDEEVDMAASSASGTIMFKAVPLEALCLWLSVFFKI